jgi:hypothetical protein
MDIKYGGLLPDWRYRAMSGYTSGNGRHADDDYEARGEARLAAAGLPWCFGEMSYPHWRRVPISSDDTRSAAYYAGDFDRCHKISMAKRSANPNLASAKKKADLLAALGRM